jgi:hypothetical protein
MGGVTRDRYSIYPIPASSLACDNRLIRRLLLALALICFGRRMARGAAPSFATQDHLDALDRGLKARGLDLSKDPLSMNDRVAMLIISDVGKGMACAKGQRSE